MKNDWKSVVSNPTSKILNGMYYKGMSNQNTSRIWNYLLSALCVKVPLFWKKHYIFIRKWNITIKLKHLNAKNVLEHFFAKLHTFSIKPSCMVQNLKNQIMNYIFANSAVTLLILYQSWMVYLFTLAKIDMAKKIYLLICKKFLSLATVTSLPTGSHHQELLE